MNVLMQTNTQTAWILKLQDKIGWVVLAERSCFKTYSSLMEGAEVLTVEEGAGRSSFCLARRSSISRSRAAVSTGFAPPKIEAVVDALGAGAEATGFSLTTTSSAGFVRGCRFSLCLVFGSLPDEDEFTLHTLPKL